MYFVGRSSTTCRQNSEDGRLRDVKQQVRRLLSGHDDGNDDAVPDDRGVFERSSSWLAVAPKPVHGHET